MPVLKSFFLLALISTQTFSNEKEWRKSIDEIYIKSGVYGHIEKLSEIMLNQLSDMTDSLEAADSQEIKNILSSSFSINLMKETLISEFLANYLAKEANILLKFYEQEKIQKITQMEIQSQELILAGKANSIELSKVSTRRKTILKELKAAIYTRELEIKLADVMIRGMFQSMNQTLPEEIKIKEEIIAENIKVAEREIKKRDLDEDLKKMILTYEAVSDADLEIYKNFAQSDSGRYFIKIMNTGIIKTFENSFNALGRGLGEFAVRKFRENTSNEINDDYEPDNYNDNESDLDTDLGSNPNDRRRDKNRNPEDEMQEEDQKNDSDIFEDLRSW